MDKAEHHKKTVLIVDDDPDVRAALRTVLVAEGFTVGEASSGEEGFRTAEEIQPDGIVLDLMMEEVDTGGKVARRLRGAGFTCPVYLLSSAGDSVRYNLDARDLGLTGIFQKPIDPVALVATLKMRLLGV